MPPFPPVRVLAIDDEEDTRANLKDILELDDYQVDTAATAAEALDRKNWPDYSAIVVDWKLPDANAAELLPRFKELAPAAAVIVVTGYADMNGAIVAMRQGAADYILKPIKPEELRARLSHVAERKRADEEIKNLAKFVSENPSPVLRIARDGTILIANEAAAPILTAWGRGVGQVVPDESLRFVQDVLSAGAVRQVERTFGQFTFSLVLKPIPEAGYVNLFGHDITELREAERRAVQAQRLAAIGQTITSMAHESRNALQRIQAALEMLAAEVQDRPGAAEYIADIQKAENGLLRLYEQLRRYAAPPVLNREKAHLGDILQDAWFQLTGERKGRDVRLEEHGDDMDLEALVDWFAVGRVFRNILENSLAACADPVRIDVSWSETTLHGRPAVRVAIRDSGPGMTAEQQQRIFEPFFTTKPQGTGLGMAISKNIIDSHGGQIVVGSGRERGTEIITTLPRDSS